MQGKEYHPPIHFAVVAIEKEDFGSRSSGIINFNIYE